MSSEDRKSFHLAFHVIFDGGIPSHFTDIEKHCQLGACLSHVLGCFRILAMMNVRMMKHSPMSNRGTDEFLLKAKGQ